MQTIWATRLSLPRPKALREPTTLAVIETCSRWLRDTAVALGTDLLDDLPADYLRHDRHSRVRVSASRLSGPDGPAWRASISDPRRSTPDEELTLTTELQVRSGDRATVVTIRQLLESPTDVLRPLRLVVEPPLLLWEILDVFPHVVSGTLPITGQPVVWDAFDMDGLADLLRDPARGAPVLVMSHHAHTGLAYPPAALAGAVAGLAQVVVLPDYDAGYLFSDVIRPPLACFGGAIRVYWPGFTTGDDSRNHRYWTSADIRPPGSSQAPHDEAGFIDFGERILTTLAAVAALRVGPDRAVLAMDRSGDAEAEADRDLLERLGHRRATDGAGTLGLSDHRREATRTVDEDGAAAQALLDEAAATIERLTVRLADREADVSRLYADRLHFEHLAHQRNQPVSDAASETQPTFADLGSAVEWAARQWSNPHIVFADDAFASARAARLEARLIPKTLDHLHRLCEVAQGWGDGTITSFKDAFRNAGYDYSARTSDVSAGRHSGQYHVGFDGAVWKLDPHLKTGEGCANLSTSIYWALDEDNRRFIVGHIGTHLPDTTTG